MLMVLCAVMGVAAQADPVVWVDAYEARTQGIDVPAFDSYTVWAWVKGDEPAKVVLGTQTLEYQPARGQDATYVWTGRDKVTLPAGVIGVMAGDTVARIALARDASFDPEKAMSGLYVFGEPRGSGDRRASIDRDTNTRYDMTKFNSREEWEAYAEPLRRKFLVACGLWPLPEKTPLNVKAEEVARHDYYIVEKVSIEARPGLLVTGNLYRPVGDGPYPGIACPHGHWSTGRFENTDACSVAGRCITFARMGMVAFSYDMVGYNDSRQFPRSWGHGGPGEDERRKQALWGIHPFGVQLWSSIRVLDYLESLPYVDKERLACTGASGGGTQTFALSAVDPRVKVSAPVNMISCSMQGGCSCENAPIIRLNASNMEIGALAAPRPMLMVAATGDWTRQTPRIEYPAIQSVYQLYDAADRLESIQIDAGHNYNKLSRDAVYRFFGKWLLGDDANWAEFTEPDFAMEAVEALQVFPGTDAPAGYPTYDELVKSITDATRARWEAIMPAGPGGVEAFRATAAPALTDALGVTLPSAGQISPRALAAEERDGYTLEHVTIGRGGANDSIPALVYRPANPTHAVVAVSGEGKLAGNAVDGSPCGLVKTWLGEGAAVVTIDPFLLGEQNAPFKKSERLNKSFPDTFLPTDFGYRVQDVLTALAYARSRADLVGSENAVDLVGLGTGGAWCLYAAALDTAVRKTVVDAPKYPREAWAMTREEEAFWIGDAYVPCIRALGDFATAGALIAPRSLTIHDAWPMDGRPTALVSYLAASGADATAAYVKRALDRTGGPAPAAAN